MRDSHGRWVGGTAKEGRNEDDGARPLNSWNEEPPRRDRDAMDAAAIAVAAIATLTQCHHRHETRISTAGPLDPLSSLNLASPQDAQIACSDSLCERGLPARRNKAYPHAVTGGLIQRCETKFPTFPWKFSTAFMWYLSRWAQGTRSMSRTSPYPNPRVWDHTAFSSSAN